MVTCVEWSSNLLFTDVEALSCYCPRKKDRNKPCEYATCSQSNGGRRIGTGNGCSLMQLFESGIMWMGCMG